jgi:hypothetical protein
MHMAGGGMHRGGRGDARASCASPLGTPLCVRIVPGLSAKCYSREIVKRYYRALRTRAVDSDSLNMDPDPACQVNPEVLMTKN